MEEDENEHHVTNNTESPFSSHDGRQRDSGFSESITGTFMKHIHLYSSINDYI